MELFRHSVFYSRPGPALVYQPCLSRIDSAHVRGQYVGLKCDDATETFLRKHGKGEEKFWTGVLAHVAHLCYSKSDANALVGRGFMFVLSTQQARTLLIASGCPEDWIADGLLDVGAGVGYVTQQLAPLARHVMATEVSTCMVRKLNKRGFESA